MSKADTAFELTTQLLQQARVAPRRDDKEVSLLFLFP